MVEIRYACCSKPCLDYKFCPYCGEKVRPANFCHECGKEIECDQKLCDEHLLQSIGLSERHFGGVYYFVDVTITKRVLLESMRKTLNK